MNNFKKILRFVLAGIITIGSIWFALRDVRLENLTDAFSRANYWWIAASIPISIIAHFVRALRWKTLLAPVKKDVSVWNAFSAVMIGYFFNAVLPRGGEVIRPVMFAREEKLSLSTVVATVVVERILDIISLLMLGVLTFFWFHDQIVRAFPLITMNKMLVLLGGSIAFLVIFVKTTFGNFLLRTLIKPISPNLYEKLEGILSKFLHGFAVFSDASMFIRLIAESALIWFLYIVPIYISFFAFDFQAEKHLQFVDANLLQVVVAVAITIAPTPGALGVFHTVMQNAMVNIYGLSPEVGLAFATVMHAAGQLLVPIVLGGFFLVRENIRGFNAFKQTDTLDDLK